MKSNQKKRVMIKQLWRILIINFTLIVFFTCLLCTDSMHRTGETAFTCLLILSMSLFVGFGSKIMTCYEQLESEGQ